MKKHERYFHSDCKPGWRAEEEKQDKAVPPPAASQRPLLPAVRAVEGGAKLTSRQRQIAQADLTAVQVPTAPAG